ncbi:type II toxin-antitoxin system VapC family toxin [Dyadobacter sp. OTU695]|uniref:type II toxin-antitoxin system VapC family toxin n=1 Tax=Dyadobacter sp. OTU695 TaxID=3043860 RepID=UPI00313C6016
MNYLIDTHTFIWFTEGNSLVGSKIRSLIENSDNHVYISVASLWEIAIKTSLRKLSMSMPYESVCDDLVRLRIELLPIKFEHTALVNRLPFYHRDPFDRMIVAQAVCENLDLLSCDDKLDKYFSHSHQKRLW